MRRFAITGQHAVTCLAALLFVHAMVVLLSFSIPMPLYFRMETAELVPGLALKVVQGSERIGTLIYPILPSLFLLALLSSDQKPIFRRGIIGFAALLLAALFSAQLTMVSRPWVAISADYFRVINAIYLIGPYAVLAMLTASFSPSERIQFGLGIIIQVLVVLALIGPQSMPLLVRNALVLLTVIISLRLHWTKQLPGRAMPWLIALTIFVVLPYLVLMLPSFFEALSIGSVSARLEAMAEALIGPLQSTRQLGGVSAGTLVLTLGAVAALCHGGAARRMDWLAAGIITLFWLIILDFLSPYAAAPLPSWPMPIGELWEMARSGALTIAQTFGAMLVWMLEALRWPALAVISGWLYLRWDWPRQSS